MILDEKGYKQFVTDGGDGKSKPREETVETYVCDYLGGVQRELGISITPETVSSKSAIKEISGTLRGRKGKTTIQNWESALFWYLCFWITKEAADDWKSGSDYEFMLAVMRQVRKKGRWHYHYARAIIQYFNRRFGSG